MSGKWLTDVEMSDVDGPPLGDYHLISDLTYEDKDGKEWVTPAGFKGDLSSFPWFVRMFLPKSLLAKAPWPHDYGYRVQPEGISRKEWDRVYREGAIAEGMDPRLAKKLYIGLRIGGGVSWLINSRKAEAASR